MASSTIYTPKQQRILLIASLLILGGFIIAGLRGYVSAFFGAGILYVIFRPLFYGLVHRKKWNRALVTTGIIIFSLFVIVLPFLVLSFLLIDRIQYYAQHTDQILGLVKQAEELTGFKITSQQNVQKMLQQGGSFASQQLPSLAGGALDFLVIIGLMFFTLFYMFTEEESFLEGLRKHLPFKRDTLKELGEQLRNNVNANVLGQGIVSLVQGILTGLTLLIFGVPDAAFWGTVAFFLAFIPVLGTPLVWLPAGLIQLSQGNTTDGVGILVVGAVVITNIDNLLRIMLAKRMGDVHPLVTLAGIVIGVPIFGILGLVIGPTILSFFIVLMQVFAKENRESRAEAVQDEANVAEHAEVQAEKVAR
ncbi:AI-2E family transporter [Fibrella forsythiae]|uniref:AI-2E family transporter n=1 Tax=Fibrella forsythiae TaxID=2817061 RepID=A0ABS3JNC2_9BACT|nr:AI-2E family transporter [Fibrella forsythiae]MBO0951501.1 AI-2E family transporter [Fibrella forsythiae]